MKRIAIIGLGTITKYYAKGLKDSSFFELCAVCDLTAEAPSRDVFSDYPFYQDYQEMICRAQPDYVMIATPPITHFTIAEYALTHGVNVLVEKPAVLSMEAYDRLTALAKQHRLLFQVVFHWQTGIEVMQFNQLYDPHKIQQIHVSVVDPYSADGITVNQEKEALQGVWIDSGVNVLSMLRLWLPFKQVDIQSLDTVRCRRSRLPLWIDVQLILDGIPARITIDWRKQQNDKRTELLYDGRPIVINHSLQYIEDGERQLDFYTMSRLEQHYYAYFTGYQEKANEDASREIHQLLLEVAKQYEETLS